MNISWLRMGPLGAVDQIVRGIYDSGCWGAAVRPNGMHRQIGFAPFGLLFDNGSLPASS